MANEKKIVISKEIDYMESVKADYHRVLQIVNNLMSNAIKFIRDGWI